MQCLALLSQPKHISRMQLPESTLTTPLNSRVLLRRFPSLFPMARLPVIHSRVSSTIPNTRRACAWALSSHERTSPLNSPANVFCLNIQIRLRFTVQHIYSHAQNLGNECAHNAAVLGTPWSRVESKHTHSLDTSFIRSQFAVCANVTTSVTFLQVLRDVRTARLPAPQRLV